MALKLSARQAQVEKPKPVAKSKEKPQNPFVELPHQLTLEEQGCVDRMLEIQQQLAPYLPMLKEQEKLKKLLCAAAQDKTRFDADLPAVLKGKKGIVEFDPEVRRREIKDKDGLLTKLSEKVGGYEPLLPLIQIPMKVVDTYLTEAEREPFIGEEEDGIRKLASVRPRKE
jgi:hypothetical protein